MNQVLHMMFSVIIKFKHLNGTGRFFRLVPLFLQVLSKTTQIKYAIALFVN